MDIHTHLVTQRTINQLMPLHGVFALELATDNHGIKMATVSYFLIISEGPEKNPNHGLDDDRVGVIRWHRRTRQ